MARVSRQERLVREMSDQVSEHLHELKSIATNPGNKENDVEVWCHNVLKNCLGYTATNGYSIRSQEKRGKMRPDLIVSKGDKVLFVVEIKKLDYNLNKSDLRSGKVQLGEYLHQMPDVKWGVLCNGYEWRLYDFSNADVGGIEVVNFDLRSDQGELDLTKRGVEDASWNLFDLHEVTCNSDEWIDYSKEATAFSPESLARAILSAEGMKAIAKVIRGEHEYKANVEVLIEKVALLLEQGLDNAMLGWNDAKQAELKKYIKSQKRVGRKRSRRIKEKSVDTAVPEVPLTSAAVPLTPASAPLVVSPQPEPDKKNVA